MERREIQKQLEESKADENPTLKGLANERELQDSKTNFILEEYFSKFGGRKYVEENLDNDIKAFLDFTKTGGVLKRTDNQELYDKFYGYIRLGGLDEKASGRGYSQTSIMRRLGDLADKVRGKMRMPKKVLNARASSRAPSRAISRIHTMQDLNTTSASNITI